uniref:JmjC domain-containing protein n=1 Tax=Arcella intermedia TaxID=1963864 RepID=A0A6B2L8J2_9EUKA
MEEPISSKNVVPIPRIKRKATPLDYDYLNASGVPAIFENQITDWECMHKWTFEWLKAQYGDKPGGLCTGIPLDLAVPYELDGPAHLLRGIPFSTVIDTVADPAPPCVSYYSAAHLRRLLPDLEADLHLEQLLPEVYNTPQDSHINLWIGTKGTRSGYHYDLAKNIFLQVRGRKRVFLVAPRDSPAMRPIPDSFSKSRVDPLQSGLSPEYHEKATVYEGVVGPGEVLVIPPLWWHYLIGLDASISVNIWYDLRLHLAGMEEQRFTWWQRACFWGSSAWGFVRAFLGFPREARLFSAPPGGAEAGMRARKALWERKWALLLSLLSVAFLLKYPHTLHSLSSHLSSLIRF